MVPVYERHMINSSDYSTVGYTNLGRMGGINEECINLGTKHIIPFHNLLNR